MENYANPFAGQALPGVQIPDELRRFYLNSTPDAAFWDYLGRSGHSGQGRNVDRYAQGQQGRLYNKFSAHVANEPDLGFWDYLNREQPNFQDDYLSQTPSQRGDSSSRSLAPRARFVNAY